MATAIEVSKYFLKLSQPDCGDFISNLKLQKLLYYAQGAHLALYSDPLFSETLQAWEHGPVVPEVYREFRENGSSAIPVDEDFDAFESSITEIQMELLNEVYEVYGQFAPWKLRKMTHQETPWKSTFDPDTKGIVIPNDVMREYFHDNLIVNG